MENEEENENQEVNQEVNQEEINVVVETKFLIENLASIIKALLEKAKIKKKYIETLLLPSSLSYYTTAFTDSSYSSENNNDYLHTLGTVSVHKLFVWYTFHTNKNIDQKILTRIKINFVKEHNSEIGKYMYDDFLPYILHDPRVHITPKIVQIVFESFIGATELLINKHYKVGLGYVVVNKICTHLFNKMDLNFDTESDSKSILKELFFDKNKQRYDIRYESIKNDDNVFIVNAYKLDKQTGIQEKIGQGSDKKKVEAEQQASDQALELFEKRGLINLKKENVKDLKEVIPYTMSNIYHAPRNQQFTNFILSLLQRVSLLSDLKLDSGDMELFAKAFTSPRVDSLNNYELLETLGDNTVNNCVVWYISKRFPQLNTPEAIAIFTKLKISIIERKGLSCLAKNLGFMEYISCGKVMCIIDKEKLLEDVFEAFFAVVELVIDKHYKKDMGYIVCYRLLSSILDEQEYSIDYEQLVDYRTQIKERVEDLTHSKFKHVCSYILEGLPKDNKNYGEVFPINNCKGDGKDLLCKDGINQKYTAIFQESKLIGKYPNGNDKYGPFETIRDTRKPRNPPFKGESYDLKEAKKIVSKEVLDYYKSIGINMKPIPKQYLKYCM